MAIPALRSGLRLFTRALKTAATKDNAFAKEFAEACGNNITRKAVRKFANQGVCKYRMFNILGRLTRHGKKEVRMLLTDFNLPKNATWDDILKAATQKTKVETQHAVEILS